MQIGGFCGILCPVIKMKQKLLGLISILCATVIWGSAFIAQSVGMDHIEPFTFQAVRCGLAVPFLMVMIFIFEDKKGRYWRNWVNPKLWKAGILCGLALFVASGTQQVGLLTTSAGKASFITAMYIIFVPMLGLFLNKKPSAVIWFSVILAVSGLYLLSCVGVSEINRGDLYLLICAIAFSFQITFVDQYAGEVDGLRLNCIQNLICSLLSGIMMILTESPNMGNILACWLPLGYAGILSSGVAYSLQIIGQKRVEPTVASLVMSLESVFAVLFGWWLLNETMTMWEILGCVLIFIAVILSQIPTKKQD